MTQKTRRLMLLIFVPLSVLLVMGAALSLLVRPVAAGEDVPAPRYVLGIHDGLVAVFLPGDAQPQFVTEAPASVLPAVDCEALHDGLPVYSEEELTRLLEDYCS